MCGGLTKAAKRNPAAGTAGFLADFRPRVTLHTDCSAKGKSNWRVYRKCGMAGLPRRRLTVGQETPGKKAQRKKKRRLKRRAKSPQRCPVHQSWLTGNSFSDHEIRGCLSELMVRLLAATRPISRSSADTRVCRVETHLDAFRAARKQEGRDESRPGRHECPRHMGQLPNVKLFLRELLGRSLTVYLADAGPGSGVVRNRDEVLAALLRPRRR